MGLLTSIVGDMNYKVHIYDTIVQNKIKKEAMRRVHVENHTTKTLNINMYNFIEKSHSIRH